MLQPLTTDKQGKLISPESKTLDYKQDLSSPGTHYEEEPCSAASLEELDLEGLSRLRGVPTTREQLVHLGLALTQSGELVPTNAGVLVAHPTPDHYLPTAYVQLARFRGTERLHISDHADVYGSIPAAIDPIMDFVLKHAYRKAVFGGIYREDVYSVPVVALRELVVNALVHANYAERGTPIRLAFYDDRIEIENPGTLLPGMTLESMKYVSKLRNPYLAKIFREAHLMEQWGTGIRRVFEELAAAGLPEPRIEEIVDRVRVTVYIQDHSALPRRQSDYDGPGSDYDGPELQGISAKLLKYLAGGSKTRQEIQLRMGIRSDGYLRRKYLSPLLEAELVELTIPDKPKSKNQQYRLTPKGKRLLARET